LKINLLLAANLNDSLTRISIEWANVLDGMGHEVVISVPRINHIDYHWWLFQQKWISGSKTATILCFFRGVGVKRLFKAWGGGEISNLSNGVVVNRFTLRANNLNMPASDYIIAMNGIYLVPNLLFLSQEKGEVVSSIHMNYSQAVVDSEKSVADWNKFQIVLENLISVRRFVESTENLKACQSFNIPVNCIIPPGINSKQFYPKKNWNKEGRPLRVVLFCHPRPHKGLSDGIRVVEKIKNNFSENEVIFSTLGDFGNFDVSIFDHHFGYLLKEEYPKALREIDILIYPELFGGFSVPPLHAMASGCAVVLNKIDGTEMYAQDMINCMLSKPGDISGMVKNVSNLIKNTNLRNKIRSSAIECSILFDWYNPVKKLVNFLNGK
jgi:glycosyltransferase involved in cell wall biosynthesis